MTELSRKIHATENQDYEAYILRSPSNEPILAGRRNMCGKLTDPSRIILLEGTEWAVYNNKNAVRHSLLFKERGLRQSGLGRTEVAVMTLELYLEQVLPPEQNISV